MMCNYSAFRHDCVNISVDISFPELVFCTQLDIIHPNDQHLAIIKNTPQPDVGGVDVACIDIQVTGVARFNTPRSLNANAAGLTHGNNARFSVASGASGCESGLYVMGINVGIPCLLDGIPDRIPVRVAGVEAGGIEFVRGSYCSSMSVKVNLGASIHSHRLHVMDVETIDCILDEDISGEVTRTTDSPRMIIGVSECKIKKIMLAVPVICMLVESFEDSAHVLGELTNSVINDVIHFQFNNPRTTAKFLRESFPVIEITSPHFKISHVNNEFFIFGTRVSIVGTRGQRGLRGPTGLIEYRLADLTGYTGSRGNRGTKGTRGKDGCDASGCGDMYGYTGPTGFSAVCEDADVVYCTCPHNVIWRPFTALMTIEDYVISGNQIKLKYRRAVYNVYQNSHGLGVNIQDLGLNIDIITGMDYSEPCV